MPRMQSGTAAPVNTKRIALAALFTAASLVLSFAQIPIFPAAPWLMYDPSGIVCLLAALAFGPKLGATVAIVSWLPRIFIDPIGAPMGIVSTCAFVIPAALVYRRAAARAEHKGVPGAMPIAPAIGGMLVGGALSIVLVCALNLVVTPLYTAISTEQVAAMIIPVLFPFNTLKMAINIVAGAALLRPCMSALAPTGHDMVTRVAARAGATEVVRANDAPSGEGADEHA